jgi:hypothetical protein
MTDLNKLHQEIKLLQTVYDMHIEAIRNNAKRACRLKKRINSMKQRAKKLERILRHDKTSIKAI